MFDSLFIVGFVFYILGIIIERRIDAKGVTFLSAEQLEHLRTGFTGLRRVNSIINTVMIVGYLTVLFATDVNTYILIGSYVVLYLITFGIIAGLYINRLQQSGFPKAFIKNFVGAKLIRMLAFIVFVSTLVSISKNWD